MVSRTYGNSMHWSVRSFT